MAATQYHMAECPACNASGVYQGFCEAKGEAVECLQCEGTGEIRVAIKPFMGRKRKRGIDFVSKSRGGFLATGVGAVGKREKYNDWWNRTTK